MSLRSELMALEETLSITTPTRINRPTAFLSTPDKNEKVGTQQAVFENIPYAPREVGQMGERIELIETVLVRFSAYDADYDRAIEIADAFKSVFMNAIAYQRAEAHGRLNGSFDYVIMRDSDEALSEYAEGRAGWELALDFTVFRDVVAP